MESRARRRPGWLVVAILAFAGGAFLAGLFLTKRSSEPAEYRDSIPGIPAQPIRIVSLDLAWQPVDVAKVAEALRPARADFVLLQGVSRKDAQVIGDALQMRHGGQLQMVYSPGNSDDPQRPGNAILGKHGLFKGRVMQRKKADSAGVVGEAVVGGKRFMLVSADFGGAWAKSDVAAVQAEVGGLTEGWKERPAPVLVGGDWAGVGIPMEPWVGTQKGAFVMSKEWLGAETQSMSNGVHVLVTKVAN